MATQEMTSEEINDLARSLLREAGISDATDTMIEITADMTAAVLDGLADNPMMNDYAGEITEYADSAAASFDLDDVVGSVDFLDYESELAEPSAGIRERVGIVAFEIMSYVANQIVSEHAPDPMEVDWSEIPTIAYGDVLVGRSREDGPLYVSVEVEDRDGFKRLSITGHSASSAGQCTDMLRASDLEPAPGLDLADLRKLADVWDRWHLNNMRAGCKHQRAIASKMGKLTHEVFTTSNYNREQDPNGIMRITGHYGRDLNGKQASRARVVCQICDYAYGSAWLREEVPADVLRFLERFTLQHDETVREVLRRDNVTEPGGEWSIYSIATQIDPNARKPSSLFDTGADTQPSEDAYAIARASVGRIDPPARYVGGTSGYLYHLPYGEVSS